MRNFTNLTELRHSSKSTLITVKNKSVEIYASHKIYPSPGQNRYCLMKNVLIWGRHQQKDWTQCKLCQPSGSFQKQQIYQHFVCIASSSGVRKCTPEAVPILARTDLNHFSNFGSVTLQCSFYCKKKSFLNLLVIFRGGYLVQTQLQSSFSMFYSSLLVIRMPQNTRLTTFPTKPLCIVISMNCQVYI